MALGRPRGFQVLIVTQIVARFCSVARFGVSFFLISKAGGSLFLHVFEMVWMLHALGVFHLNQMSANQRHDQPRPEHRAPNQKTDSKWQLTLYEWVR